MQGAGNVSAVVQTQSLAASALPLVADTDPDRILVWRNDRPVSAREFLADVHALATRLPSARQCVNVCEDRYEFLRAFCAVALAGQTNLLPSTRTPQAIAETQHAYPDSYCLSERELDSTLPRAFIVPTHLETRIDDTMPTEIAAAHVIAIGFTSGSTGQPKAIVKTWGGFCASTQRNAQVLNAHAAPNLVATVPPQHMYGLELSVLLPLRTHAAIHAGQPFLPADIAHALAHVPAPRVLVTTPHHLRALLDADVDLPALDAVVSATAPLDAALAARIEQRFSTRVIELFGSTETCVIAHRRTTLDEAWRLYDGVELHPQPDGTLVQAAYFSAPMLLQDIVELRDARHFVLCGRNADLLDIAGKRASLSEINRRLLAIPGVRDGAVFELDADARGIRRLAALVVAPEISAEQILAALRDAIDPVFVPRQIRRVKDLPRNAVGKLPRAAMMEALHKRSP